MENKGITELSKEWQDILTKGCNMFKFSAEEYPEDEGKEYIAEYEREMLSQENKEENKNGNERL